MHKKLNENDGGTPWRINVELNEPFASLIVWLIGEKQLFLIGKCFEYYLAMQFGE